VIFTVTKPAPGIVAMLEGAEYLTSTESSVKAQPEIKAANARTNTIRLINKPLN
jgi:hypothetical protein